MKPEVEAHLRTLVNFPSPPAVATHIIELARDPQIELGKVARALSLDPALASKILRVANSPLYAQRRRSENLRQALVVLGLNATLTLALSFSLVKSLRSGKSNGISHTHYWRRSLLCATSARALADALHHPLAEENFLAALLQDVGLLALDQAIPDLYQGGEPLQHDHAALAAMEKTRLQANHAEIGAWLMRSWNLPERLHQAIAHSHHVDPTYTADPNAIFERCVALSGPLADLFLLPSEQRRFGETALAAERTLGLDTIAFGQVLATVGTMIPETERLFEAESLAVQQPEQIIEQAREVLMLRSLTALRELAALRDVAGPTSAQSVDVREEARRDSLTGVYNRAHLDLLLPDKFATATRENQPLSIAFADLGHFKLLQERFGREAGDRILASAARILCANTRKDDCVTRYGEERFLLVLPGTDAPTAAAVAARIVSAFEETEHLIGSQSVRTTLRVGCATHAGGAAFANPGQLCKAAEQALIDAKLRNPERSAPIERPIPSARAARGG